MSSSFTLPDAASADDLATYLGRAERVENGSVRLIAAGGVLAVYAAVFFPQGLLDESPTILGLRTYQIAEKDDLDVVVPIASFSARLAGARAEVFDGPIAVTLPIGVNTVTWAAISPPRGGWAPLGTLEATLLEQVARAGIDRIASALPEGAGEQIVHRIRADVWAMPLREAEHVPAGAAFAAVALGFLGGGEQVSVYETGPWTRLTTRRGHVLVKRRGWTMAR